MLASPPTHPIPRTQSGSPQPPELDHFLAAAEAIELFATDPFRAGRLVSEGNSAVARACSAYRIEGCQDLYGKDKVDMNVFLQVMNNFAECGKGLWASSATTPDVESTRCRYSVAADQVVGSVGDGSRPDRLGRAGSWSCRPECAGPPRSRVMFLISWNQTASVAV